MLCTRMPSPRCHTATEQDYKTWPYMYAAFDSAHSGAWSGCSSSAVKAYVPGVRIVNVTLYKAVPQQQPFTQSNAVYQICTDDCHTAPSWHPYCAKSRDSNRAIQPIASPVKASYKSRLSPVLYSAGNRRVAQRTVNIRGC